MEALERKRQYVDERKEDDKEWERHTQKGELDVESGKEESANHSIRSTKTNLPEIETGVADTRTNTNHISDHSEMNQINQYDESHMDLLQNGNGSDLDCDDLLYDSDNDDATQQC